jgi:hypothetical protein
MVGLNTMRLSSEQITQIHQRVAESFGPVTGSPCGHGTAKPLT